MKKDLVIINHNKMDTKQMHCMYKIHIKSGKNN